MTPAQVREKCGELRKSGALPELESENIPHMEELAVHGRECTYIFPEFAKAPLDHIALSPIRFSVGSLDKISDQELREKLKELFPPRIRQFVQAGDIEREKIGRFRTISVNGSVAFKESQILAPQCYFRIFQNSRGFFVFVQMVSLERSIKVNEYLYQSIENMKNL